MNILVIDDEELICWSLKRSIEQHMGHSVTCVHTGSEAIKKVMENNFDIIIADLKLPDINGVDIIKRIRELKVNTPVIIMSAYLSQEIEKDIAVYGVSRFINKPFQIEEILNSVSMTGF